MGRQATYLEGLAQRCRAEVGVVDGGGAYVQEQGRALREPLCAHQPAPTAQTVEGVEETLLFGDLEERHGGVKRVVAGPPGEGFVAKHGAALHLDDRLVDRADPPAQQDVDQRLAFAPRFEARVELAVTPRGLEQTQHLGAGPDRRVAEGHGDADRRAQRLAQVGVGDLAAALLDRLADLDPKGGQLLLEERGVVGLAEEEHRDLVPAHLAREEHVPGAEAISHHVFEGAGQPLESLGPGLAAVELFDPAERPRIDQHHPHRAGGRETIRDGRDRLADRRDAGLRQQALRGVLAGVHVG